MAHTRKKDRVSFTGPAGKHRAVRRCAWTREAHPKDELLRLVLDPSGRVFVDLLGRGPGRGVYISPHRSVVAAALSQKGLQRIFRGRASGLGFAPKTEDAQTSEGASRRSAPQPSDHIASQVLDRAVELIALARRAGQLEVGTDIVLQGLENNICGSLVVLAQDLSPKTANKVRERARGGAVRIRVFGTKDRLGDALGRGSTGVLRCLPGNLADRITAEGTRLAALMNDPAVELQPVTPSQSTTPTASGTMSSEAVNHQTGIHTWTRTNNAHLVGVGENESTVGKPGDSDVPSRTGATRYSD